MGAALLIVDMQKAFFDLDACQPSLSAALGYINGTAELFRKHGLPVFLVQDTETGGGPGNAGFALFEGLRVEKGDRRVSKAYSNAFWKTSLEADLRKENSEFIVVSGFAAAGCVIHTYNGAVERGFAAAVLQNGIAAARDIHIQTVSETCDAISYSVLEYFFMKLKQPAAHGMSGRGDR